MGFFVQKSLPKKSKSRKVISVKHIQRFFAVQKKTIIKYARDVASSLTRKTVKYATKKASLFSKRAQTVIDGVAEQSKKEITLLKNNNCHIAIKPYLVTQGALAFAASLFLFAIVSTIVFSGQQLNQARFIQTAQTRQLTPIVAEGAPIKWVTLVKKSDITSERNLVVLPKNASRIKVETITSQQALAIASTTIQDPASQLTMQARKHLAGRFSVDLAGINFRTTNTAGLLEVKEAALRFLQALNAFFFADIEEAVSNVVDQIVQSNTDTITETPAATVVDVSKEEKQEAKQEEKEEKQEEKETKKEEETPAIDEVQTPSATDTTTETEPAQTEEAQTQTEVEAPTAETTVEAPAAEPAQSSGIEAGASSADEATPAAAAEPETEYVAVTYETPAPTIKEQETDTGKLVTVSAPASAQGSGVAMPAGSNDTFSSATSDVAPTLTNVLAHTNIPEIYKVGQEDKIKLKWKTNGDQLMEFHAYDLNNNGKLDYVEWTVPHLSDQVFEIIFISKAWLLDSSKEITEDIYDQVKTQDNTYATVPGNNYVRVTFQATLTNNNDITIYAKPTESGTPITIEVYATDTNQLVTTFDPITSEGTYKVLLTTLQTPTDVFDLRITGGSLDIDYIVDPVGWLTGWAHRKKITIDNANVDADLTNFPALVKFTSDANVGVSSLATGYDIRFTDAGGTNLLAYERESWTGGAGAAATANFWVKVPTIATSADTDIYMYYGKSDSTDWASATSTLTNCTTITNAQCAWKEGASQSFAAVWHLNEGTGVNNADSTGNVNTGTPVNVTADASGKIGGGEAFGGTSSITMSDTASLDLPTAWTYSAWVKRGANVGSAVDPLFSHWINTTTSRQILIYYATPDNKVYVNVPYISDTLHGTAAISNTNWHLVTATRSGNLWTTYVDGAYDNSTTAAITQEASANGLVLGESTQLNWHLRGSLDEARVSSSARSADWIKFEYANQSSADAELAFAAEENNLTWLAGWTYRKKITIDHTKVGATTEDETNFPVLISLSSITGANTNGTDIRFTTSDGGTYLAREIESYASNTLVAWVKVPVLSHDYDTSIYMYWGNSSATEPAADSTYGSQNVWDSNFKAVYHLKEATDATVNDSTSNANNSTAQTWTQATGKVDGSGSFNGTTDTITVPGDASELVSNFTIEVWGKINDLTSGRNLLGLPGTSGLNNRIDLYINSGGNQINLDVYDKNGSVYSLNAAVTSVQDWNFYAVTRDSSVANVLYANGANAASGNSADVRDGSATTRTLSYPFYGLIDEVRISSVARSAGWISTEYANQNSPSTFYTVDDVATQSSGTGITWTNGSGDNKWSTAGNWQGGAVPTSADTAVFNSTATDDCTIDTNVSVKGINIVSGYSGTITQSSTYTVTVGTEGFTQAGGTFTGGDSAVTINGAFSLSGGTFTATSGILTFASTFTNSGTFNVGTGTIVFTSVLTPYTLPNLTYNNLTINGSGTTFNLSASLTVDGTTTLTSGTLDLAGYTLTVNDQITMGAATLIGNNGGTISNNITLAGNATVQIDLSNTFTLSGIIADGAGTYGLTKTGAGTLTLSGDNTFDGGVTIKAGTLAGGSNANNFGTGTITIGDTSGTADATLDLHNGANTTVFPNPISVASGNSGTAKIISYFTGATLDHAITLPTSPNSHDLTLAINPTILSYTSLSVTGGITGIGNITIDDSGVNDGITLSGTSINNTGTITNTSTSYGATTTISAVIGANVTGITQNSATSALTLSGVNTYTGPITNSAGTLNLTQTTAYSTMTLAGDSTTKLTAGKTFTLTSLVSNGTLGHLANLQSSAGGSTAAVTTASAQIATDYLAVTDVTAVQTNTWYAGANGSLSGTTTNWALSTNTAPNAPTLVSPANASYTTDNTPTLSANYSDSDTGDVGTTNYRISSSGLADCTANTNVVAWGASSATATNNESTTWTNATSIGSDGTYYWCAQNDDGVAQSAWTQMGSFILDASAPDIVAIDAGASSGDRTSLTSDAWFKYSSTGSDDQISFSWTDPSSVSDNTFYYELNADSGSTITGDESTTANPYIDSITVTEGTSYFHARPKNGAGTWGTERTFIVKYDKTTPTTSDDFANNDTWVATNQTITLTPADSGGSELAWTKYCTSSNSCDPSSGTAYTVPVVISTEGTSYFRYASADNAGNTQTTVSKTVKIDKTKPITAADGGSYTFGTWSNTNVTVTLICADTSGSGCSATLYCTDASDTCTPNSVYATPVEVSTTGTSYIRYASTDFVSNAEIAKTQTIKIDTAGSAVNAGTDKSKNAQFTQDATATAGTSPIAGYQWSKVSGTGTITFGTATAEDTTVSASQEGTFVIRLTVTDEASNSVADDFTLIWDTTNPVANAGAGQTKKAQFTQTGSATDTGGSGVAVYAWSKVSGPGTITFGTDYLAETTISADTDGTYVIRLTATDNATNSGTDDFTLIWDIASPTTSDDFANNDTWVTANQTITLTPADSGGSELAWTKYCTTASCDPASGTAYTTPVTISTEGTTYFRYASADNAGNTQTTVQKIVKIDTTDPITAADAGVYTFNTESTASVTVTLLCVDTNGSGCATTLYCTDTTDACVPDTLYTTPVTVSTEGTSYIRYSSTDFVSNAETAKSQTIKISITAVGPAPATAAGGLTDAQQNQPSPWAQPAVETVVPPATEETPAPNIITQIAEQVAETAKQIAEIFIPSSTEQTQITYPPIEETVPVNAPVALQGWNIMEVKPLSELALTPVKSDISFFADKIPQFKETLTAFGIDVNNVNDVKKVVGTELYLPGLTQTILTQAGNLDVNEFASVQGVPLASLSPEARQKIPSDIVFARTGGELIDYSMAISLNKEGRVQQKITTVSAKPMELVVKPDQPASSVMGYMTLVKSEVGGTNKPSVLGYITKFLTASVVSSVNNPPSPEASAGQGALLVDKFAYAETQPGIFTANISAPATEGEYEVSTVIVPKDILLAPKETKMAVVVNPEGYVYNQTPDGRLRIQGASVSLYYLNTATKEYELWPADKFLQKNPIKTDETGKFSFLVPKGTYKLKVEATNYTAYESEPFEMKKDIAVSMNVELFRKSGLFGWLNWQSIIIALLVAVIILLFTIVIIFIKRSPARR